MNSEKDPSSKNKERVVTRIEYVEADGIRYKNKRTQKYNRDNKLIKQTDELYDQRERKISSQTEEYNPKNDQLIAFTRTKYDKNNRKALEEREKYEYDQKTGRLKTRKYVKYILNRKVAERLEKYDLVNDQLKEAVHVKYEQDQAISETVERYNPENNQIIERTNTEYENGRKKSEEIETFNPEDGRPIESRLILYEDGQKKSEEIKIFIYEDVDEKTPAEDQKGASGDNQSGDFAPVKNSRGLTGNQLPPRINQDKPPENSPTAHLIYIRYGRNGQKESETVKIINYQNKDGLPKRTIISPEGSKTIIKKTEMNYSELESLNRLSPDKIERLIENKDGLPKRTIISPEGSKTIIKKTEMNYSALESLNRLSPDKIERLIEKKYLPPKLRNQEIVKEFEIMRDSKSDRLEKEKKAAKEETKKKEEEMKSKLEEMRQTIKQKAEKERENQKDQSLVKLQAKKLEDAQLYKQSTRKGIRAFIVIIISILVLFILYYLANRL